LCRSLTASPVAGDALHCRGHAQSAFHGKRASTTRASRCGVAEERVELSHGALPGGIGRDECVIGVALVGWGRNQSSSVMVRARDRFNQRAGWKQGHAGQARHGRWWSRASSR
jgi:hypothetical protein